MPEVENVKWDCWFGLQVYFVLLRLFSEVLEKERRYGGGDALPTVHILTQAVKHSCALPSKHSLSYTSSTAAYTRPGIEHRGAFVLRTYYFPSRYVLQVGYYDSSSVDG